LIARPFASALAFVKEALERYSNIGKAHDIFVILQPTSPLRTAADIINALKKMILNNADSVVSVCEADHSPLLCNVLPDDGSMKGFVRPEIMAKTRQELPTFYRINGAIYAVSTSYFLKSRNIYNGNSYEYIMPRERSVDIDTLFDFSFAEFLLTANSFS